MEDSFYQKARSRCQRKDGVSFVSVTHQFNTTTSMGRLTLNVLLSFAQFEREGAARSVAEHFPAAAAAASCCTNSETMRFNSFHC
jgi:DNA invertase Pin-like site-specific DNA recombinase